MPFAHRPSSDWHSSLNTDMTGIYSEAVCKGLTKHVTVQDLHAHRRTRAVYRQRRISELRPGDPGGLTCFPNPGPRPAVRMLKCFDQPAILKCQPDGVDALKQHVPLA